MRGKKEIISDEASSSPLCVDFLEPLIFLPLLKGSVDVQVPKAMKRTFLITQSDANNRHNTMAMKP
jgi:hypothetical protein